MSTSSVTKIFIEGHGCSASLADTEILAGLISGGGYELVESEYEADLSVIVTCSVKSVTEQRMLSRIRELSDQGKRKLIVAGCLAKADPSKITKINPAMSMVGPGNLDKILPMIETTLSGGTMVATQTSKLIKLGMPRSRRNDVIGIVEISSGCLSSCTFCQVKLVKGTVFSYPEEQIVSEAESMVRQGAKEIWLTSTDNAAYGRDNRTSLPNLIRHVSAIQGDFKIRVGMMNPLLTDRILEELVQVFKNEKVFKFLHLPVQSGSNHLLELMQRGYTIDDFHRTLDILRSEIPNLTLSTDMIVGFPSETDSEFEESMELLRGVRPDIVNLSRFGARAGTMAATMENQTSSEVAKERSTKMTRLIKNISRENNLRWIGWKGKILVDEVVKDALIGRNFAYKPCLVKSDSVSDIRVELGREVDVEVYDATASTLRVKFV